MTHQIFIKTATGPHFYAIWKLIVMLLDYIDYHINKLACLHPSYLKNTYDFVQNIRNEPTYEQHLIVTGDVTSLYTKMNIDRTVLNERWPLLESNFQTDRIRKL